MSWRAKGRAEAPALHLQGTVSGTGWCGAAQCACAHLLHLCPELYTAAYLHLQVAFLAEESCVQATPACWAGSGGPPALGA